MPTIKITVCMESELVMATRNVVLTPPQDQVIHDLCSQAVIRTLAK
jgi:hypothetical protein